jgi:hypothetical protein
VILAAARRGAASESQLPSADLLEPALLALTPYLLADQEAERQRSLEDERREADEIWTALERYPVPRRRKLIEQAPRASRSRALAARIRAASLEAAPHGVQEALELADLALFIAGRVPEKEGPRTVERVRRVIEEVEGRLREIGPEGGTAS